MQQVPWEKTKFSHALGTNLIARVLQGRAEKTTCPAVQMDSNHVLERVRDLDLERVMDPGHGLEGDPNSGGVGRPSMGPFEDPTWRPLLAAQEEGDVRMGPSSQGFNKNRSWADSLRLEESRSSAKIPLVH